MWKHFVIHPDTATLPALATCSADKQGKYVEYEKKAWEKGWPNGRFGGFTKEMLVDVAKETQLDVAKFTKDMDGPECAERLKLDENHVRAIGVRGTPSLYVNGRRVNDRSLPGLKSLIDEEIKKADEAMKGKKIDNYYETLVAAGKKSP